MSIEFALNLPKVSKHSINHKPLGSISLNGNKGGSTAILIHGLTGAPNELRHAAVSLHRAGYNVSCPRLANHGQPLSVLKRTKWQECYQSVREDFLNIRKIHPSDKVVVAGLSMGALLALVLAEEFPDQIAAVSCLSPTLFYDGWNTPFSRCLLPLAYHTPLKHFFYFKEEAPYGIKNEAIRARAHQYFGRASLKDMGSVEQFGYPYFPVTLLHQLHLLVKHLTPKLPRIQMPVQIIQARNDDMTSTRNAYFIYDRISSSVKEIILLEDSFHIITADQERTKVSRKMLQFFSGL